MPSPSARVFLPRPASWSRYLSSKLLVALFAASTFGAGALAQSAHVAGLVSTFGTSIANAQGTATDASGNVYIANADGVIYKESYSAATGTYTQTMLLTTPSQSSAGIAVNSSGTSLYVSTGTGKTVEWFKGAGTTYTLQNTFSGFSGVAVPAMIQSVGIYIADQGSGKIYKETYSSYTNFIQTTVATGFSTPTSMAVDAANDVFVTDMLDNGTSRVTKLSGSTYAKTVLTISGLSNLHGIAVDSAGDLYIESASTVIEATLNAGVYTTSEFYPYNGQSLVLDNAGNLYLGSPFQSGETKLTIAPSFGSVPVATPAQQIPIAFTIDASITLGTPTAVTQGTAGLDFSLGTGSTCTGAVEAAGNTCVVYVAFTPRAVGRRLGAVNLFSSAGTLIATALVSGTGTGPQVLFLPDPNLGMTETSQLNSPRGLSLDAAGNMYMGAAGAVLKLSLASGNTTTLSTICAHTTSTTVDGAGNVYFGCYTNKTLYELAGGQGTVAPIATGVYFDYNLAIDGTGNLFTSDVSTGAIIEVMAGSHAVTALIAGGAGRRFMGMALDANGNLFAVDYNNNILYELVAGTSSLTVLASGSPMSHPSAIAVDSAGNLYVSNPSTQYVYRYGAASYAAPPTQLQAYGETGIVMDTSGTIYSVFDNYVLEFPRNTVSPLAFANTAVGATSAAQTITIENDGNANLTFSPGATGNNPSLSAGFAVGPSSTCPQLSSSSSPVVLAPGASCTDVMSFAPIQAGSGNGMMVTTDDSLNLPGTSQSFALSGTATAGTPTVIVANASAVVNSNVTLTAVILGSGVAPAGAVTFNVASGPAIQATCTAGTSAETCTVSDPTTGLSAGSNSISVSYAADSNYAAANGAGVLSLTAPALTVSPSFGSVPVGTPAALMAITFTIASSVTLGVPAVLTQGSMGLDFTLGTGSTCAGAATAGSTCIVNVAFTPQTVGQRLGAVNLLSSGGTLLATSFVSGTGAGPQLLFPPLPGTVYSTGLSSPRGLSLDSAGNMYLANTGVGTLLEVSLASGTWTTVGSGCPTPAATTLDGAGNIYASCNTNGTLYEIAKGTASPIAIASGITFDDNLSIDGAGNLYASDENSGAIFKISAGTHAVTTLIAGNAGRRFVGMTIDGKGNLFAPDFNNNILYEVVAGTSSLTLLASGSPLGNPHTIAVDSAGNLYVSNYWGSNVYRYSAANYAAAPTTLPIPGQTGLVIDSSGTIYTIVNNSTLQAFPRNAGPSLAFPDTPIGGTSPSQTVTLENDGNANLTFSPSANGDNPSISTGFTIESSSTCCPQLLGSSSPATLASGATCTDAISFTPTQAGSVSGMLITTDDSLNFPGTLQKFLVSGTATVGNPSVAVASASAAALSPAILTAVISGSGIAPSGAVTFKVASGSAVLAVCAEGPSAETCTVSYPTTSLPSGQNAISVTYAADSNYAAASGAGTLTLTADAPTISWQSPSSFVYPAALSSTQLNATASVPGSFVYTPSAGTILGVGAGQSLSVTFTPTDTSQYAPATAAVSVTVTQATPSIAWPTPTAVPHGTALSDIQLDATASVAGTFQYTPSTGTVLGIGTQTLSVQFLPNDPGYTSTTQTVNLVVTGSPGFPSTSVGSTSSSVNVLVALNNAATISSISAATSQGSEQEYTVGAISGCVVDGSTVNPSGTVCTVGVTFSPAYSGYRNVPLQLVTSTGILSAGLIGLGTGPQVALTPGTISTVAGNGNGCADATSGCGDGAAATAATLSGPVALTLDNAGNIYSADTGDNRIRMISEATGIITTLAGNGTPCTNPTDGCGDNGPAINANLNDPFGTAVDAAGNVYISDRGDNRVRMVAAGSGIITTIAGTGAGCSTPNCGDGGPAVSAAIVGPDGLVVDAAGNLYVADIYNARIRKIAAVTGIITTVAGNGSQCGDPAPGCGDGGPALEAGLNLPTGVTLDNNGNLYIADWGAQRIRKVSLATGIITTVAGTGTPCSGSTSPCGDGGPAASATIYYAEEVAVDPAGNIYIADTADNRIRRISASTGIITTVAGSGVPCSAPTCGDGGSSVSANLSYPKGIALDGLGNLYVSETSGNRLRKIDVTSSSMNFATTAVGTTSADSPQSTTVSNIGNVDLAVATPGTGNNPSVPDGYTLAAGTTCPQLTASSSAAVLAAGADCMLSVNFAPIVSGPADTALTFADNALNNVASAQEIALSSSAFQNVPIITWPQPAAIVYGAALSSSQLNAAASVAGTFAYRPAAGILPAGSQTLTATFTPTDNVTYSSATLSRTLMVDQATPIITWVNPASVPYGTLLESVQLNATANTAGTFAYTPAAGTLPALGTNLLSVIFMPTDTADYVQASSTVPLNVSQAATTTLLSASPTSPIYGANVTLTAAISSSGNPITTGIITFLNNGTPIGTGTIANGLATISTASLPTGTNAITATYGATTNFATSTSNAVQVTVLPQATTTTLTASQLNPTLGASVTLTAATSSGNGPVAAGSVTFLNNGTSIGTGTIVNGFASLTLATLPSGTNVLSAEYGGAVDLNTSFSAAVSVTVTPPAPKTPFVTISISAPLPVTPGNVVTATTKLTAGDSYSGTMKLTCALTTAPAGARNLPVCSFSPATLTIALDGDSTTLLAFQTTGKSTDSESRTSRPTLWSLGGGSALAGLLLFFIPSKRRRLLSIAGGLLMILTLGTVGCGAGLTILETPTASLATTPGLYIFTITATDTIDPNINTSTVVNVSVQ